MSCMIIEYAGIVEGSFGSVERKKIVMVALMCVPATVDSSVLFIIIIFFSFACFKCHPIVSNGLDVGSVLTILQYRVDGSGGQPSRSRHDVNPRHTPPSTWPPLQSHHNLFCAVNLGCRRWSTASVSLPTWYIHWSKNITHDIPHQTHTTPSSMP